MYYHECQVNISQFFVDLGPTHKVARVKVDDIEIKSLNLWLAFVFLHLF